MQVAASREHAGSLELSRLSDLPEETGGLTDELFARAIPLLESASDDPETGGLTDELLARAIPLLESASDDPVLIDLLLFLLDGAPPPLPPNAPLSQIPPGGTLTPRPMVPLALRSHLRLVRALELTQRAWGSGVAALLRAQRRAVAAQRRAGAALLELLFAMIRQSSDADARLLLNDRREGAPLERPREPVSDEAALLEAMRPEHVRPELTEAVNLALQGGMTLAAAADAVVRAIPDGLPANGNGVLVCTILRAAVNGTLKELRQGGGSAAGGEDGCPGFSVAACASLIAAVDERRSPPHSGNGGGGGGAAGGVHLARVLLHVVTERIYEAAVVPPCGDNTSPSTVDTQPSPATPDSLSIPSKGGGGDDTVERQDATLALIAVCLARGLLLWEDDATLALIAVCLARGLLLWEDVEAAVKSHLHNVEHVQRLLDERKTVLFSRLLLNFVELLLTNRRTPTLSDVYLMLKYLVQLSGPWKGPATACIQQLSGPWKGPATACIQPVVQDSGFGPITACDDPRAFLKECCNPCLLILKTQ
ncbi:hypothetical protein T484DRAFT_1784117, partial [Baffinella frigidus]